MDMAGKRHLLPVYRVDTSMPGARAWGLAGTTRPVMVIVDRDGAQVQRVEGWGTVTQDRARFRAILSSYLTGDNGATQSPVPSIDTMDTTVDVTPMANMISAAPSSERDQVYLGDLEKAVEYSLTREVAMQPMLDQQKLKALVYYIEVLLNYLPGIRGPVKKFLVSLRDWPVQMGYSSLPHTLYKKKVEELLELHQPFARTPTEWTGCKGSSPQYRGYPCALWTLFHALSVNAAAKDPAFHYGGVSSVANSMIGRPLIFLFSLIFSFRLCQSILQLQGLCPPFCQPCVQPGVLANKSGPNHSLALDYTQHCKQEFSRRCHRRPSTPQSSMAFNFSMSTVQKKQRSMDSTDFDQRRTVEPG